MVPPTSNKGNYLSLKLTSAFQASGDGKNSQSIWGI
jgi:hypothetical protein